jgi:hypothetical protein
MPEGSPRVVRFEPRRILPVPDSVEVSTTPDASDEPTPPAQYYCGGFGAFMSLFDITLQFSSRRPTGKTNVECEVILSPQHAKLVELVLAKQIATYEAMYGLINIPQEVYTKLGLAPPEKKS